MKIKYGRRDRGMGVVPAIIILLLLMVFVGGMFILLVRALHRIDTHNTGGGSETNDLAYTGPGMVVFQMTNIVQVPTD